MDFNAHYRAWMNGATEAEAVRAGEDAYFEYQAHAAQERAAYEAMERDADEHEQRLIAEHEANNNMTLKKLLEEATPLPWAIGADPTSIVATQAGRPYVTTIAETKAYKHMREPNAKLIIHAVNTLPSLEVAANALVAKLRASYIPVPDNWQGELDALVNALAGVNNLPNAEVTCDGSE
jgi:hypothetical protein